MRRFRLVTHPSIIALFVSSALGALALGGCDEDEPTPASTSAEAPEEPEAPEESAAPRPPPDFEGNWYVLDEGQSLEAFAESIGVDVEIVRERAREIDRAYHHELETHIEEAFPQVAEAFGGHIRMPHFGTSHVVEADEDIWALSDRFETSVVEILIVNGLGPDDASEIEAGQRLIIPGVVRNAAGVVRHLDRPTTEESRELAREHGLGTRAIASHLLMGGITEELVEVAGGAEGSGTFAQPVSGGWFVRGFGSGDEGYHKAVDVAGHIGWPVRAIDDGIVAYSGDQIRGYGNIVMVMHAGGFVSFHAHLSESYVHAGQRVERGDILAELGSTGISRGPHVHFELIHRGKNCDPVPLFRPNIRNHDGEEREVPQVSWNGVDAPPSEVACVDRPAHHPHSRWVVHEDPTPGTPPPG